MIPIPFCHWEAGIPKKGRYIYALLDPQDGSVRYVGKCQGYINTRWRRHLYEAERYLDRTNHRLNWIRSVLNSGRQPHVAVLTLAAESEDLSLLERGWVALMRSRGCHLTNATDGGEGQPNPSPETREKLRRRPQVGFRESARVAASEFMKRRWQDPEFRERMRQANVRRRDPSSPHSHFRPRVAFWGPEHREAIRTANGKPKSDEHRRKISQSVKNYYKDKPGPNTGRKHSEATRKKMREAWKRRKARMLAEGGGAP